MAPTSSSSPQGVRPRAPSPTATFGNWRDSKNPEAFIVESWSQGFFFGALLIMAIITVVNMKRRVLLHKLVLLELLLAMSHGTFCFMSFDGYGYYLASTAALLNCSYFVHNVVAWLKIRPFFCGTQSIFSSTFSNWVPRIYLATLALSAPALIFNIYNIFRYFNNYSRLFAKVRPYEPLFRDPWWVFSCMTLLQVIRKSYGLNIWRLCKKSPRFGFMLLAMFLALVFTTVDILASVIPGLSVVGGINPYWKLSLVFKCLTDNILLDDFKSVLQRLGALSYDRSSRTTSSGDMDTTQVNSKYELTERRERRLSSAATVIPLVHRDSDQINFIDTLHDVSDVALAGHGSGGRKGSSSSVGKVGVKIKRLPQLPSRKAVGNV